MIKFTSIAIISSLLILSGCGGSSTTVVEEEPDLNPLNVSSYDGTWTNGCTFDQTDGIGRLDTTTINGAEGLFKVEIFDNDTCSGTAKTSTRELLLIYRDEIALNNCLNVRQVFIDPRFPIVENDKTITQEQFDALTQVDKDDIDFVQTLATLLCTNENGTILFNGDLDTIPLDGSTFPTAADIADPLGIKQ